MYVCNVFKSLIKNKIQDGVNYDDNINCLQYKSLSLNKVQAVFIVGIMGIKAKVC
jgi:hypothetical protein